MEDPYDFMSIFDTESNERAVDMVFGPEQPLPFSPPTVQTAIATNTVRWCNTRYLLTYKTHLPKDDFKTFLGRMKPVKYCFIAWETGDSDCPYEHTHVCVQFTKPVDTRNARYFDYKDIHPNVKILRTSKDWEKACHYIGKEDKTTESEVKALFVTGCSTVEGILGCKTAIEAVKKFADKDLRNVSSIVQVHDLKLTEFETRAVEPRDGWQKELAAYVANPKPVALERKIIWYYDKRGGTGKTYMARYFGSLQDTDGKPWVVITGAMVQDSNHMWNFLNGKIREGWNAHGVIVDLARASKFKTNYYAALEELLNGMGSSTKYKGCALQFNPPWVICFSNFWPHVEMLSSDRWIINELTEDGEAIEREQHYMEPERFIKE